MIFTTPFQKPPTRQSVFVDTRGSGRSARPADQARMSSSDMAGDLEALRAHLGLDTINFLAHSNAGAIAIFYATRYPNRIKQLVLVSTQMLGFSAVSDTQGSCGKSTNARSFPPLPVYNPVRSR